MAEVERLYYDEKQSVKAVADALGVSPGCIQARMKKAGLKLCSKSNASTPRKIRIDIEKATDLYFRKGLTLVQVGARMGVSGFVVRNCLVDAGYEIRQKGETKSGKRVTTSKFTDADLAEMVRLYCEEWLSSKEIAGQFDCSDVSVRNKLKQQGVVLRTGKESQALRRKKESGDHPAKHAKPPATVVRIPKSEVTPAVIVGLRKDENLTIDAIAERCGLENMEVYTVLQSEGVL